MNLFSPRGFFRLIKWALGGDVAPERSHSSGFSSASLMPESRERALAERLVTASCSLLTLLVLVCPALLRLEVMTTPSEWFVSMLPHVLCAPFLGWVAWMHLPRRRPMDSIALGTGLFTLTPWFVPYALSLVLPFFRPDILVATLGWQLAGLAASIGIGLWLDVAAEIRAKGSGKG